VVYTGSASVENSMIADDCVIEGTVINSVLFRGVKVERGAVVRDSVLFSGTYVGKNASLNCIVTDKDVYISDGVVLSGNENMPFYIQKRRKV
jgi:glucose-1-phosphate adenylyltransferase